MPKTREKLQPFVELRLLRRFPEVVGPLMAAVDAFDSAHELGKLSSQQLQALIDAASSARCPLIENTCDFMQILSAAWPQVAEAMLTMSESPKAHIRRNAIVCLGSGTPKEIIDRILRTGLRDRSALVRKKAADFIGRLRQEHLVPALEEALTMEKDAGTREEIELELHLLRDGYFLRPCPNGGAWVTVFIRSGMCSRRFDDERLHTEGIEVIAAELRNSDRS